jgi:hypothetical protein
LVNICRASGDLILELQHQDFLAGEENRIGPPPTLEGQFILENDAPAVRIRTSG